MIKETSLYTTNLKNLHRRAATKENKTPDQTVNKRGKQGNFTSQLNQPYQTL